MFDSFNISTNMIIAALVAFSPYFFDSPDITIKDVQKSYVLAQERAHYIIATGDTTAVKDIDAALGNLALYEQNLKVLTPVLKTIHSQLADSGILNGLALPPG